MFGQVAWCIDLFCLVQIYKEFIYDIDLALPKTIKKSMAIVIAQKKLYRFISIMIPDEKLYVENEKKIQRGNVETQKAFKGILKLH